MLFPGTTRSAAGSGSGRQKPTQTHGDSQGTAQLFGRWAEVIEGERCRVAGRQSALKFQIFPLPRLIPDSAFLQRQTIVDSTEFLCASEISGIIRKLSLLRLGNGREPRPMALGAAVGTLQRVTSFDRHRFSRKSSVMASNVTLMVGYRRAVPFLMRTISVGVCDAKNFAPGRDEPSASIGSLRNAQPLPAAVVVGCK